MYCRMCNSIPGLLPLDASSIFPVVKTKNVFRHYQIAPGVVSGSKIVPSGEPLVQTKVSFNKDVLCQLDQTLFSYCGPWGIRVA